MAKAQALSPKRLAQALRQLPAAATRAAAAATVPQILGIIDNRLEVHR